MAFRTVRLMAIAGPANPIPPGTIVTSDTNAARTMPNYFQLEISGTTAQRPKASDPDIAGLPAGSSYYDTSLSKVVYWDGANWRDPTSGAIV